MQTKMWIIALAGLIGLSACGDTVLEQGLMGAGAGAGTAILLGGDAKAGAALGAGVNIFCQNSANC